MEAREELRIAIGMLATCTETFHILKPKKVYSNEKNRLYVHEDHVFRYGFAGCNLIYARELHANILYDFRQLYDPCYILHSPLEYRELEGRVADFANDSSPSEGGQIERVVLRI